MKKMFAIVLALMLCVTALSVVAFAAEGDTVTVHAQVPIDWDSPCVYSWIKDGQGPAWPGDTMTLEGDWWVGEVSVDNNMVIISNNGTPQTIDLEVEAGKDVYVVVTELSDDGVKYNADISYEAPAADAPSTDAPSTDAPATDAPETTPETGDMGIAAVSMALLAATAGLVATVSKKKEN